MIDGKELDLLRELKSKVCGQFPFEWREAITSKLPRSEEMKKAYSYQMKTIKEYLERIEGEAFNE